MLNADRAPYFATCPRCGEGGLERLKTHAYCVNCNYGEVYDSGELVSIPPWVREHFAAKRKRCEVVELPILIPKIKDRAV